MIIAIDVDGVCADLNSEWLRRINDAQGTSFTSDDVTEWDMSKLSVDGFDVYSILRDKDIYRHVAPIPGALEAVNAMRGAGHRVVFVTSCTLGQYDAKERWLVREGFLQDEYTHRDLVLASDKALVKADLLIDDGLHNVEAFPGKVILIDQPYNRKTDIKYPRAANLVDALRLLGELEYQQRVEHQRRVESAAPVFTFPSGVR